MISIDLNGERHSLEADPDMPLLWAIRDLIGLTGTKYGCGAAQCGACSVLIDGVRNFSCQVPLSQVGNGKITTIEGVSGPVATAVQNAWTALAVAQCGYCQSGQVMAAIALLSQNKAPSDSDIDAAMSGNLCRCATYHRIRAAIHEAAKALA